MTEIRPGLTLLQCPGDAALSSFSIPVIKPDYNQTTDDVYLEVATEILIRSKTMDVVSTVQHDPNKVKLENVSPSWVPRWDRHQIYDYLCLNNPVGVWKPNVDRGFCIPNEKVLICLGILIDTVSSSTDLITADSLSSMGLWKSIVAFDLSPRFSTGLEKVQTYQRTLTANNSLGGVRVLARFTNEQLWYNFAAFWSELYNADHAVRGYTIGARIFPFPELEEAAKRGNQDDFLCLAYGVSDGRRVFCTDRGFLGIGPGILKPGDVVCILPCSVPFVLRPVNSHYLLVGECYLDGIMNGEETDISKTMLFEIH